MEDLYEKAKEILAKYNQQHLLLFYEKLNTQKQEELLHQILNINFEHLENLYNTINKQTEDEKKVQPIEYIDKYKISNEEYERYEKIGKEELKNGKLAVITMAGGQGTRLRTQWTKRYFCTKYKSRA